MLKIPKNLSVRNLLLNSVTSLTLADRRLYNYLLHHAFSRLTQQLNFVLPFAELKGVYGTGLPPFNRLQESVKRLMQTLIEFEADSQNWIVTSLLENCTVDKQKEEISYSYSIFCRALFMNPLTLEKCLIQAHFMQKYSNLLYEILSEAHFSGERTVALEVADLRDRLLIPREKLSNFGDLKRFVLLPALYEINAYASFAVKFSTENKGMKVLRVIFEITTKRNLQQINDTKQIIPPKRPIFFIDNPELERAYAYLLNAETTCRRKLFNKAVKLATKKGVILTEEDFDLADVWFCWVEDELLKLSK